MAGARNAVETCLDVRPGEHVALIADEASRAVAASIAAALDDRRATYNDCCWKILDHARWPPHQGLYWTPWKPLTSA